MNKYTPRIGNNRYHPSKELRRSRSKTAKLSRRRNRGQRA